MSHEVWLDEVNHVLRMFLVGRCSYEELNELWERSRELLNGTHSRKAIIDLTAIEAFPDEDVRDQLRKETRNSGLTRVAVIATRPEVKVVGITLIRSLGKDAETAFFENEDQALQWLLSEN